MEKLIQPLNAMNDFYDDFVKKYSNIVYFILFLCRKKT